jgi:hypothetical protein
MISRALAILAVLIGLVVPSYAQSPSLEPNPLITGMTQEKSDPAALAEFKGFIGTAGAADTVRIYRDLSLTMFYDIPRAAIVQSSQKPGDLTAEVTVIVRGDTVITVGVKGKAGQISSLAAQYGQHVGSGAQRISACAAACIECGWVALSCAFCFGCEVGYLTSH